jgi:hypothetical protein
MNVQVTMPPPVDLTTIKGRQQIAWGSGDAVLALMRVSFAILFLGVITPSNSLSLNDPVSSWPCVTEERENVVNFLVTLAGQGRPELDEEFFEKCIADIALEPNLYAERIRDVADGCAYMSTLVFAESD